MAGFRNVVPPLGIGGFQPSGPDGGFDSPIPVLRIGGGAAAGQLGGFGTPIATLVIRTAGRRGAGFYSIIPAIRLGATAEEPEAPSAGGGSWIARGVSFRPQAFRDQLVEDEIDDTLDAVIEDAERLREQGLVDDVSTGAIREITVRRLRARNQFVRNLRKTEQLSERMAILKLEARLNDILRRRNRPLSQASEEEKIAAKALQEAMDIEALLVIIGTVV